MAAVRGDEGAILLIVLFVTTVLAVVIGVVLTNVEVNLRNSTVAQNLANKTYAADGGVEYVIQRLRQDPNACSDPNLSPWQQNNTTVTVSCTSNSGAAPFGSGWAVITTDSGPASLSTTAGSGVDVNGPTYVAGGLDLTSDLTVRLGPLMQSSTPCPQKTGGGSLGSTQSACTTIPVTGAQPPLPCVASCAPGSQYTFADRGSGPAYTIGSGASACGIFLPGKYVAAPDLATYDDYYFASGVYYFENADIAISGVHLIGGKQGASETAFVGSSACDDDSLAGVSDGSGVEWILGGTSAVSVSSASSTAVELFTRQPAGSALEGAAGISIRSVPAAAPVGYAPSSAGNVFTIGGGIVTEVAVHGLVYAPNSGITVSATGAPSSELSGGVVASTLVLRPEPGIGPGPNGMVSTRPLADAHQFVTIASTAEGGATKNVTTTAVIELSNSPDRAVVIDSWVTNAA